MRKISNAVKPVVGNYKVANSLVTVVSLHCGYAVYHDDKLVLHERNGRDYPVSVLRALGHNVTVLDHSDRPFNEYLQWTPLESLDQMVLRYTEYERSRKLSDLYSARQTVKYLEEELGLKGEG